MKPLGKLDKLDHRDYWVNEARDFTPWLGEEANLKLLAETIGVGELELVAEEELVGDFRADILAKDSEGKYVVIENQLEPSNHGHLGQLLTYSSGLEAAFVVWVAPQIRDEHRKAVDWLNSAANGAISFFALEIELWRIGESDATPKFNVVCRPNTWESKLKASVAGQSNPLYREFWEGFLKFCKQGNASPRLTQLPPPTVRWYKIRLDVSKIYIELKIPTKSDMLTCQLVVENRESKATFEKLQSGKEQIEAELGGTAEWSGPPEAGQRGKVVRTLQGNIQNRDEWGKYFAWLKDQAETFYKVFYRRTKELHLNDEDA